MPITPLRDTGSSGGGAGTLAHLYASLAPFNLGVGATVDATALTAAFTASTGPFVQQVPVLSHGSAGGVTLELPAGQFNLNNVVGHIIDCASCVGDLIIQGQGAGATTLFLPNRGGGQGAMGSSSVTNGAATVSGNTFTLPFAAPPAGSAGAGVAVGDIIAFQAPTQGVLKWHHYCVTAAAVAGDPTKVQYMHGFAGAVGTQLAVCAPPVGTTVYFIGIGLNFVNTRNPNEVWLRDLTVKSGSTTGTPLDACLVRRGSRVHIASTVRLVNGWAWEIITAAPAGSGQQVLQNTDHSSAQFTGQGGSIGTLMVDNSSNGWIQNIGLPGNGGGRDYYWGAAPTSDFGAPALYHICLNDGGAIQNGDFSGLNMKSSYVPIYGEGFDAITPAEPVKIDELRGAWKLESPLNWGLFYGESGAEDLRLNNLPSLQCEAGIAINGTGGNAPSETPYHLTNCSIAGTVMTGTIVESPHARKVGDIVITANGSNANLNGSGTIISVAGQVITVSRADLPGNVAGPATCTMGTAGFIRAGTLEWINFAWSPNPVGQDRFSHAQLYIDLSTAECGTIFLSLPNATVAGSPALCLPQIRIRDSEPFAGGDGSRAGGDPANQFTAPSAVFQASDVGKTVVCPIVAAGTDTIATVLSDTQVLMTGAVGAGTAQAWTLATKKNADPPRVRIIRGTQEYVLRVHDGGDPNPIVAGDCVEILATTNNNLRCQRSTASKSFLPGGLAQSGSPAGSITTVTTNGLTGNRGRNLQNFPVILCLQPGGQVTTDDDLGPFLVTGSVPASSLLAEVGDGTVQAAVGGPPPTAGQRIVGVAQHSSAAGVVPGELCVPYWTT